MTYRTIVWWAVAIAMAGLVPAPAWAQHEHDEHDHAHDHDHSTHELPAAQVDRAPWPAEITTLARQIPVQDGGRVKPLDTVARFTLLQLSGRMTARGLEDEKLTPIEWMLDCLFYPALARNYRVFLIESPEVMDALNLDHEKMRDRFAYIDLFPARTTLLQLAQQYAQIEQNQRTRVQSQMLNLAHNLHQFELLAHFYDFARQPLPVGNSTTLQAIFPGQSEVSYSQALAHGPDIVSALIALRSDEAETGAAAPADTEMDRTAGFFRRLELASQNAHGLALIPPAASADAEPEWLTPGDMLTHFFHAPEGFAQQTLLLGELEALERMKAEPPAFLAHLERFHAGTVALADARGEHRGVPLEAAYYRLNLLDYSLWLYVLAFLIVALCWMRPQSKPLWWAALVATSIPLMLHTAAIVVRCVIRQRPPVTTLYETIIFIAAVAVLCALLMEYMNRRRISIGLAAFLGAFGLFLANRYQVHEGVDTMPSLIAVLDTNFWLSVHVITITIGYAGGMLAAAIAHVYLFGKAFGIRRNDKQFYKSLTRMTYGAVCFGLLFAATGTVLGGIWANDSWGRFWGWDPKENGALMIVLWQIIMLHARMGGYIRDYGLHMASVFGGIIVVFAWFGVNLLGVGLHSYGFTSGIHTAVTIYYLSQSAVLFIGAIGWLRMQGLLRLPRRAEQPAKATPVVTETELVGK